MAIVYLLERTAQPKVMKPGLYLPWVSIYRFNTKRKNGIMLILYAYRYMLIGKCEVHYFENVSDQN